MDLKKRVMFIVGVMLIFFIFLSSTTANTCEPLDPSEYKQAALQDVSVFTEHGFNYAYALGIGPTDDDREGGCGPIDYGAPFYLLRQQKIDSKLTAWYLPELFYRVGAGTPCEGGHSSCPQNNVQTCCISRGEYYCSPRDDALCPAPVSHTCSWHDLPLTNTMGCYFFSDENDRYEEEDRCLPDSYGDPPDDCAGWFIPAGENSKLDSSTAYTGIKSQFFGDEEMTVQNTLLRLGTDSEIESQYLTYGEALSYEGDEGYLAGVNAACLFNEYQTTTPLDQAFICLKEEREFRWYICDENSLYEDTGKFIPAEPVENTCDNEDDCLGFDECQEETEEETEEGETGNLCECSDGQCLLGGQPLSEDAPHAWICKYDDDESKYFWEEKDMDCDDLEFIGESCQENKIVCEADGYSYHEVEGDQNCCGLEGISDFGRKAAADDGNYLCLNKNMVHSMGNTEDSWELCDNDWCWVSASSNVVDFQIYTVNVPGQPNYDWISNRQDWFRCAEGEDEGPLPPPDIGTATGEGGEVTTVNYFPDANRFYCYQEGSHWSWADCPDELATTEPDNGIKKRNLGDGLFALPVSQAGEEGSSSFYFSPSVYETFYGEDFTFNIIDYNTLEFMLQFTGERIVEPARVIVTIKGPGEEREDGPIYFEQNVLADTTNNPVLEPGKWIHVRVSLPVTAEQPLLSISEISFVSEGDNPMLLRNVYLTKAGFDNQLCSGKASSNPGESAWLTDMDFYENRNWNSIDLCNLYYSFADEEGTLTHPAWLGDDTFISDLNAERRCCGDDEEDYYAGPSEQNFGCWNAEPIAPGETTMNVQYTVDYKESVTKIDYGEPIDIAVKANYWSGGFVPVELENVVEEGFSPCQRVVSPEELAGQEICGTIPEIEDLEVPRDSSREWDPVYLHFEEGHVHPNIRYSQEEYTGQLSLTSSPLRLQASDPENDEIRATEEVFLEIGEERTGEIYLELENPALSVEVYFLDPADGTEYGEDHPITPAMLEQKEKTFYVMARLTDDYQISVIPQKPAAKTSDFIHSCRQSECLYPLPGDPPYTITNPYPHLYDLYFVAGPRDENEYPVGEQLETSAIRDETGVLAKGNIRVKRVSPQIVFVNEGEESEEMPKFYGCQAAGFIKDNLPVTFPATGYEELGLCSVKAEQFCSPSREWTGGRERYTTINSWDDKELSEVGYDLSSISEALDVNALYGNWNLLLRTAGVDRNGHGLPFLAKERNFITSILPARNFISNPLFAGAGGTVLPHWEIELGEDLRLRIEEETSSFRLEAGEVLKTERIPIPKESTLHFSQASDCDVEILLLNKDGGEAGDPFDLEQIETEDASFAIIQVFGPCKLKQPMLQLTDELGPAAYYDFTETARSGLACCPESYCWNGYACVEPFGPYTYLAEHIAEGRDYRCINGEWTHLPVKLDWNAQSWGFCEKESQCFVLSSMGTADNPTGTADQKNSAESFYNNEFPTCINDGEFIFDNYCQQGEWTSRTKFLADKLMEVAGDDDYILYCAPYADVLLNFNNPGDMENYLGGESPGPVPAGGVEGMEGSILPTGEAEVRRLCFPDLTTDLVDSKDNTCVNNICLLKESDGTVSFATTLNNNLTDAESSFLYALNIPSDQLEIICPPGGSGFRKCNLNLAGIEGDLWYSPELKALVYGKYGVQLTPNIFARTINSLMELLRGFLGLESPAEEMTFLSEAKNFRDLYLLKKGAQEVRVLREEFSRYNQTLVAEYEGFSTPVCDYVNHVSLPLGVSTEFLEEVAGMGKKVSCTSEDGIQRVEISKGIDFFWPHLTGKMRVG